MSNAWSQLIKASCLHSRGERASMSDSAMRVGPSSNKTMIYKSSRLTSGNRIFRTSLDVEGHQITYRKSRWLGSTEETINVDHISSVRAQHGLMFSSITIESSGGSQPIVITGLHGSDAREIENAIRATQGPGRQPAPPRE